MPSFVLGEGCIDVWTRTIEGDALGGPEAARARRAGSRAFLRRVLAGYLAVPAADLAISTQCLHCGDPRHGKPTVSVSGGAPVLRFNVSHSGGCQVVAVADREVGVDVERHRPLPELEQLAQSILAPDLADALLALPRSERLRAFYREWTKREACLKGVGLGLAADPKALTFEPTRADARFERLRVPPPSSVWSVRMLDLGPDHTAALAAEGPPFRLRMLDQARPEGVPGVSSSARAVRSARAGRGSAAS